MTEGGDPFGDQRGAAAMSPRYLSLSTVLRFEPEARARGVSTVARSARGFLTQYKRAGGDPAKLTPYWRRRRDNFVARHVAQAKAHGEPWWRDGEPTRRHLALIMWAYSPTPSKLGA